MPGICSLMLLVVLICFASSSHAANTIINNGAANDKPVLLRLTSSAPPGVRSVSSVQTEADDDHLTISQRAASTIIIKEASYFLDVAVQMGTPPQSLTLQATTIDGCMAMPPLIQIEPSYCKGAQYQCSSFQTTKSSTFQSTSQLPEVGNWNPDVDVDVFTFTDIYGNKYSKKMLFVPVDSSKSSSYSFVPQSCAQNTQACYDATSNPIKCPSNIAGSMPLFAVDQLVSASSNNPVPIRTNYSKSLTEALCPNGPRSAIITGYSDSKSWSNALLTLCRYSGMQATILSKFQISFPQAKGNQVFYTWTQSTYPLRPTPGQTLGMNSALTGSMFLRYPLFVEFAHAIEKVTGKNPASCSFINVPDYEVALSSLQLCGISFATFPTLTFTFAGPCEYGSKGWCEGTAVVSPSSYLTPVPGFNSNRQKCYTLAIGSSPATMTTAEVFGLPLYREQNISLMTPPGAMAGNNAMKRLNFLPENVLMFIESRTPLVRIPTYNDTCLRGYGTQHYPDCTDYVPGSFVPPEPYCLSGRYPYLASGSDDESANSSSSWQSVVAGIGGAGALVVGVGLAVYLHKKYRRRSYVTMAGRTHFELAA